MSRRTSRNNNYSSGIRPSGIFRATVTAVNGSLVNVKIPRLGLENIYEDCPVVGPTPSVNDNIFVGFLEGQTSNPVALTSTDANTGDIDSVVAGTALSGGGSSGDVTLNFAPSELSSATVSTSDKIVIADADDSDNPKTVTVQSIVDLSPVGDVTGVTAGTALSGGGTSGTVTVNFAPSELSSVTVATDDKVVIADTSDSDNPKHVTAQSIANLAAATPGGSTSQIQYNNSGSFAGSANFTFDGTSTVTLTDTDAGSEAAPIIELYRNSASPADADYIGQIKFQAENDADQKVVYAKLTGKIDDASDTTEDGILEIMLQKAGSNNIAMRFTSTTMKLINSTGIEVNGAGQFDSTVDIDDDLTIGTDKFFVDVSTGKTGVGTTSPVAAIDLVGQVGDTFTTSNWRKAVGINTGNLLYWRTASSVDWGIGATGGDMYFTSSTASDNSAAPDYRMIIKGDTGNVGIGTTAPNHSLSFGTPANGSRQIGLYENGTAHYGMGTDVNRLAFYASNSSGTAERMVINSDGDVGIGTTNPGYQLDVNGNLRSSSHIDVTSGTNNQLRLTANTTTARPYLQFTNYNGSSYVRRGYIGYPAAGGSTASINIVADNGNVMIQGTNGEVNASPKLSINSGPELSDPSSANYLRVTSANGTIDLGPQNTTYCHIYTDRGQFYMNKDLHLAGTSSNEGGELTLENATSYSLDWTIDNYQNILRFFNSSLNNQDVRMMFLNTTTGNNTVRWNSNGSLLRYTSLTEKKEDIEDIGGILGYLNERNPLYDLSPKIFHEKDGVDADGEATNTTRGEYIYGMLAEDVYKVLPEICHTDGKGSLSSFGIESLIPLLVAEIQRLGGMVETLYQAHDADYTPPALRPASRADAEKAVFQNAIPDERAAYNAMRDHVIAKYEGMEGRENITLPEELPPLD